MSSNAEAIVNIRSGEIEGVLEDGVFSFKGVPYAAPPVDNLRWLPPQPVAPWEGVRPAKEYGAISPQNELPGGEIIPGKIEEPQDEDCLFLNVWTKGLDDGRRPVMVWIHGGAFIIGSGTEAMYRNGNIVTRGDVVLVTINYRLGALGFMNLNEITGGKIPATGCEGFLDQVAGLEWIRDNIEAFGGDPDNITVFGESAGGMSIASLMSMPLAKGKFHKAILESGAGNTVCSLEEGVEAVAKFLDILGLKGKDADALRSLTTEQILDTQQKLGIYMMETEGRITPHQPVVDGVVLPGVPIEAIEKGSAADIKTLAGTNLEEFKLFAATDPTLHNIDDEGMVNRLKRLIPPEQVSKVVSAYRKARESRGENTSPKEILTAIQTDLMFRVSCLKLVEAQCNNNQPAYNYLFTWKSPMMGGILGACHALEIGFVLGNYNDSFCGSGTDAEELSRKMQDAWIAFALTGDPSCESLGKWEPYCDNRTTMIFDRDCRIENAPYEEERAIWDTFDMLFTMPI
ncbi:carboxylesterase/lipase family protein [Thermodesulfobacteriota bacterium]